MQGWVNEYGGKDKQLRGRDYILKVFVSITKFKEWTSPGLWTVITANSNRSVWVFSQQPLFFFQYHRSKTNDPIVISFLSFLLSFDLGFSLPFAFATFLFLLLWPLKWKNIKYQSIMQHCNMTKNKQTETKKQQIKK